MTNFLKIKDDTKEAREAGIKALGNNVQLIGSAFKLPLGVHRLLVAEKDAFAILTAVRKSDGKEFALPIVAGTITYQDGTTETVEATDKAGAKTLVVPPDSFLNMKCNCDYDITVAEVNGRNIVIAVTEHTDDD